MDPDFSLIQARLSHEDDLVNQRVSWLVNSQSFLLTAYAITLNGLAADASKPLAIVQRKLLNLLPVVGIVCVVLVAVALLGGLSAIGELRSYRLDELCQRSAISYFQTDDSIPRSQRAGSHSARFSCHLGGVCFRETWRVGESRGIVRASAYGRT